MCEPNELVKQFKQEQDFEYASSRVKSSHMHRGGKSGGQGMFSSKGQRHELKTNQPILPTENGAVSIDSATSLSRSGSRRVDKSSSY